MNGRSAIIEFRSDRVSSRIPLRQKWNSQHSNYREILFRGQRFVGTMGTPFYESHHRVLLLCHFVCYIQLNKNIKNFPHIFERVLNTLKVKNKKYFWILLNTVIFLSGFYAMSIFECNWVSEIFWVFLFSRFYDMSIAQWILNTLSIAVNIFVEYDWISRIFFLRRY